MTTPLNNLGRGTVPLQERPQLAEAAFETVRQNAGFLEAADASLRTLLTTRAASTPDGSPSITADELNTPTLTAPSAQAQEQLEGSAKLTLLLGRLSALLGDVSTSQLESRLATFKAAMDSQKAQGEALSLALQEKLALAESATAVYETAVQTLATAKTANEDAKQKLAEAQTAIAGLSPDDPAYASAKATLDQAAALVSTTGQALTRADAEATNAHGFATEKANEVERQLSQVQTQAQNMVGARNQAETQGAAEALSNIAKLTSLMAQFITLVGQSNEASLKNDLEVFQAMQKAREAEMEKKSQEFQEEARKAEELNKVMGCVGKILGAIVTFVSVVAAVFTGGATLAFALVGAALMAGDMIASEVSGVSFMEKAMAPLMDNVLKPLMQAISGAITKALEAAGVDPKEAAKIGGILGGVLAAVAIVVVIVVVMVVAKSAPVANLVKELKGALTDAFSKLAEKLASKLPEAMVLAASRIATSISTGFTTGVTGAAAKMGTTRAMAANSLQIAAVTSQIVNVTTTSGINIARGVHSYNANDALSEVTLSRAALEQISQALKRAVEGYGESQKVTAEMFRSMSDAINQDAEAGRAVLRRGRI